jgi:hypothetical protein
VIASAGASSSYLAEASSSASEFALPSGPLNIWDTCAFWLALA